VAGLSRHIRGGRDVERALNAWGDDVFLAIAEGAIKFRGALASSE
jgi:hypothetical protein